MKHQFLWLGLSLGLTFSVTSMAVAVQPVSVSQHSKVDWSKVVDDRFDGKIVYDKNFDSGGSFVFVSSWSPQGIRATYTEYQSEIIGHRTVWRSRWIKDRGKRREIHYPEQEPIYRRSRTDSTPNSIKFSINGRVYTYEQGPVSPELATALTGAPPGNMTIRLMWDSGATTDMEIGKATVEAWKTVFKYVSVPSP